MRTLIPLLAAFAALAGACCHAHAAPAATGDSWSVRQANGLCLLENTVTDFGTIRFVGAPGTPVRLEVLGHRDMFAAGAVGLYRVAPPWHPLHPSRETIGAADQRAGSSLLVADPLATQVLMALYDGYEAHLRHAAWYGGEADVRISNTHLRRHYEDFARCLRSPAADGWSSYERTRIEYDSAQVDLREPDRERLRQVAAYVREDSQVTQIYVDGHTDDVGAAFGNLQVSRRRAEQVAAFLRQCGVPGDRIVVRYHGDKYPVERPDSDEARARNRRTTVRLERAWPEVANR